MLTYEELWKEVGGVIRDQMELLAKTMLRLAKQGLFINYGISDVMSMRMKTGERRVEDWVYFYVALNEDRSKSVMCNFDLRFKQTWPSIEGGVISRFYLELDGETLYSYDSGSEIDWRADPKRLKKWVKEIAARKRKEIMKAILKVAPPEWQNLWE